MVVQGFGKTVPRCLTFNTSFLCGVHSTSAAKSVFRSNRELEFRDMRLRRRAKILG
jgi:hypothetical protein